MYLSKTKNLKMWFLLKGTVRRQFKSTLQGGARKTMLVKGQKTLTFSTDQEEPAKKVKAIMKKI